MKSILVPLDCSAFSEQALPLAIKLAKESNATLHLLSIYSLNNAIWLESTTYIDSDLAAAFQKRYQTYLDSISARIRQQGVSVEATVLPQSGSISKLITEHAEQLHADLVIISTHGRGGLARMFLGSVADELIRQLNMPLIAVRPQEANVDVSQSPQLQRILVPLDGAEEAEKMLPAVEKIAKVTNAQLTLLQVITPLLATEYEPQGIANFDEEVSQLLKKSEEIQTHLRQEAEQYLERVASQLQQHGLTVETQIAIRENPAKAILDIADQEAFDLIALETHGRKGISRWVLGSVADKIIRGATIPIMVHRPVSV